jgi:hypothetical protein
VNRFDLSGETVDPGDGLSPRGLRRRAREIAEHNNVRVTCVGKAGCSVSSTVRSKLVRGYASSALNKLASAIYKAVTNPVTNQSMGSRVRSSVETVQGFYGNDLAGRIAGCAEAANEGMREMSGLAGIPGGKAAQGLYAATRCVAGFLS